MTAESTAKALGGRKVGGHWMARCPAHHDRKPSLSIRDADDGKVLVHCHAGCDQAAVIAILRSLGLWSSAASTGIARAETDDDSKNRDYALSIWRSAKSAKGTLVETYLAARGIRGPLAPALRFHRALKHPSGGTWPAMVAAVQCGVRNHLLAIHRTFLAPTALKRRQLSLKK